MITYLYYAKFYDNDSVSLYKIGISSDVYKRVTDLKPDGFFCKLIVMERFPDLDSARKAETLLKMMGKRYRSKDTHNLPYTETFSMDILDLDYAED